MQRSCHLSKSICLIALFATTAGAAESAPIVLFDGSSFTGWEGDTQATWRIEEGAIVAGSLEKSAPRNEFLATTRQFENFDLRLKFKVEGTEKVNAGVQFRTKRIPNHHEVIGYQADIGPEHDGKLYDESRRKKTLVFPNPEHVAAARRNLDKSGWYDYRIRAEGPRIRIWLNDFPTVDYVEPEKNIDERGVVALQIHGGMKAIIRYKDISIVELPSNAERLAARTQQPSAPSMNRFGAATTDIAVQPPFAEGKFTLRTGDVVVFTGQTDMVRSRQDGTLEACLSLAFADAKPLFRNMAWEGDTVYEQWRDINFGSWSDQLNSAGATVVFTQFGAMESLAGPEKIPEFIAAYERLLDQFVAKSKRIVLLSPRPFEKPVGAHFPDNTPKNAGVAEYSQAISKLAAKRGLIYVDLLTPLTKSDRRLTTNGIHLTPEAQPIVATLVAEALRVPPAATEKLESLLPAIREKNRLWFDNWRPMNWTFAFGDRTEQPFGKPGGSKPALRIELEEFIPLIAAADTRIHDIAIGAIAKTPPAVTSSVAAPADANSLDHSPEAELASFKIADGFEANLFASEADGVVKPLQMRWDDRGRLWVLCAPTYPHIDPGAKPADYILVCEDTNQDGRADRFTRFAEGLFIPMGIEFGADGIYVTEASELVHLKDSDGDSKADQRTVLLSGFGTADSHQMINGAHWGPGGELWFTQGHHAYSHVETPRGVVALHKSGVWRYRPQTGRLDAYFNLSTAGLNGQGVAADNWGQIFHNSGAWSGGFYTVPGMIPTGNPIKYYSMAVPDRRNTGIEFIGTPHLPDEWQGLIVWGGFMSNNVQVHRLVDDGSGFTAQVEPDLVRSSRREFRPVNVRTGPDGALYVCDWYNAVIGHYQASYRDPARDKTRGRIWRISAKGRPLTTQPDLAAMKPSDLIDQLRSPDRLTRHNAKRRLFDLPEAEAIAATNAWLAKLDPADPQYEQLLVEAIGVYEAHEAVPMDLLKRLLSAKDARARAYATRVVGHLAESRAGEKAAAGIVDDSSSFADLLDLLRERIRDEHPRVRLETIVASSYFPIAEAMEVAAEAVDMPRDRYIDYALTQCVHALKPLWLPALSHGDLQLGGKVERLRFVLEADGAKDLAGLVRKLAANPELTAAARERVLVLLVNLGKPGDLRYAFDQARRSVEVLDELAVAANLHRKVPSGDLIEPLTELMKETNPALRVAAIRLAGAWRASSLAPAIRKEAARKYASEASIGAALRSLAQLDGSAALPALEGFAVGTQPAAIQSAAVAAITQVNVEKGAASVARLLPTVGSEAAMAELLAPLLNQRNGTDLLAKALASTKPSADAAKLAHRVMSAAGRGDLALMDVLNRAIGLGPSKIEYNAALVADLTRESASGNAERGREVFLSKLANCTACHKLHGKGGDLGPDLSIVGAGRSPEVLIEAVLWPNRQIREGFMLTRVVIDDGQMFTGYKLKETADELHLRDTSNNQIRRIAKETIEDSAEAGSLMPEGLTVAMTRDELRDLIRFLRDLK